MMKTDRAKSLCVPLAEECGRDDMGKDMVTAAAGLKHKSDK